MGAKAKSPQLASLADLLGVPEERLAALRAYDDTQVQVLEQAVAEAIAVEDVEFEAAAEKAIGLLPRLVRGPARSMLLGGHRHG